MGALALDPAAAAASLVGLDAGADFESDELDVAVRLTVGKVGVVGEGLALVVEDGFLEAADADFSVRGRGLLLLLVAVLVDGLDEPVYPVEALSTGRGALDASPVDLADPFTLDASRGCFCSEALASSPAFLLAGIPFPGLADAVDEGPEGFPSIEARRSPIYDGGRGSVGRRANGVGRWVLGWALGACDTWQVWGRQDRDQISDLPACLMISRALARSQR